MPIHLALHALSRQYRRLHCVTFPAPPVVPSGRRSYPGGRDIGGVVFGEGARGAEEVTVGLASHWPRVTDFSGLSTYELTA